MHGAKLRLKQRLRYTVALGYMKSLVSLLSLMSYIRGEIRSDWIVDVIKLQHKTELPNKYMSPPPPQQLIANLIRSNYISHRLW